MSVPPDNQEILENELDISQIIAELNLKRKLLEDTKKALSESQAYGHNLEQELEIQKHKAADFRSKLDLALVHLRQCEQQAAQSSDKEARLECAARERDAIKDRLRIVQQKNDELENQLEELRSRNKSNDIRKTAIYEQIEQFKKKEIAVNQYIQDHQTDEAEFRKDLKSSKTMTSVLQNSIKYYKELNEKYYKEKQEYTKEITDFTGQLQILQMEKRKSDNNIIENSKEDYQKTIAYLQEALQKEREIATRLTLQTEEQSVESKKSYISLQTNNEMKETTTE